MLQSIATSRDEMNKGMTRKEMITLMSELFSVSSKAAENHFDYLIKSKQFPELKQGGRVVSAQVTTTNYTAITTQKLLWTYNTIQLAWAKQAKFNGWNVCPSLLIQNEGGVDDKKIRDFFTVNLEETCFMASEGHLQVIGSVAKIKHEKNTANSRQSITVVHLESAAGVEGPLIYLAKGKELTVASMIDKNFARIHKAPTGSYVKMTPNAYMTNEVWLDITPSLCKGMYVGVGSAVGTVAASRYLSILWWM